MNISLIAAISENNAIGRGNDLPWHLPDDFKFFKATTLGQPVLMGRKTLESMGKPLPGRTNIVITRNPSRQQTPGTATFSSVGAALQWLESQGQQQLFIIGGGQIFTDTIGMADELIITLVHTIINDADVFFPAIDHTQWKLVHEKHHPTDEKHAYSFTFQHFKRIGL